MATLHLTQHRVDRLKPKKVILDVRDTELKGFGIRIMPSGARRYFIHSQHEGRRLWKTFDAADTVTVAQARQRARAILAAYRNGDSTDSGIEKDVLFETAAEDVFVHYERLWKPGTLRVNRHYLHRQILPFFAGRMISAITRQDIAAWFRTLHATPAAANRSAPILSVIMQKAESWGYRPENSNPCVDIRRYRETRRERFLLPEEYRSLAAVLARHQSRHPLHAAAVQLLLLTGCRKSEIITLRWTDYREGKLFLRGQQDRPAHGLAGKSRSRCARQPPSEEHMGLFGNKTQAVPSRPFLAAGPRGGRIERRPPARPSPLLCRYF